MNDLKKREHGAISVVQARRREKAYMHLTSIATVVGLLSVSLIIIANQMSDSVLQNPESVRLVFVMGVALAPVSFVIYIFAHIAAIAAQRRGWNFVVGFLSSLQTIISLIFARDILLIDSSSRLSHQTPNWSSYVLWSILIASLLLTLTLGIYSRKSV